MMELNIMNDEPPVVFLIDDDASVRGGVTDLLRSVGLRVEAFTSTQEFQRRARTDAAACIVLDVRLPGPSGLEFQRTLLGSNDELPIIFISGYSDIPMSVRAMKSGAIEFLTKPLHQQALLDAIQLGIERNRADRQERRIDEELQERFDSLTPREREILTLIITGRPNKQVAADAHLSELTVKVHRSHVMHKMGARSLVELVRMADRLGISGKS